MKMNNKNTASQALLDLDEMKSMLKEESKKTISALLAEAVKESLNDSIEDTDGEEDDEEEYTISDTKTNDVATKGDEDEKSEAEDENSEEDDNEPVESDEESDDEKWSQFDKYKNEDGAIDFSGEKGDGSEEDIVKVYKLLKDSDQIVVKKTGDKVDIKDNEAGTEYIVDFGCDSPDCEVEAEKLNENIELEPFDDEGEDYSEENDEEYDPLGLNQEGEEVEFGDEGMEDDFDEFEIDPNLSSDDEPNPVPEQELEENKKRKTMKENKNDVLFEVDLGYTDDYQKESPIDGLSVEEPSNNVNADKGVPTLSQKPWACKKENADEPYELEVTTDSNDTDSLDEQVVLGSEANNRGSVKSACKRNAKKGFKHVSKGGKYQSRVSESVEEKMEKLMKENKALKQAALAVKKNLQEAVLVNVNLGQIVKLLQENTTSRAEKIDIVNRFDKVTSFSESKALAESISRELAKNGKKVAPLQEAQLSAGDNAQRLNEAKVYENPALAEIRTMMSRMDKAY